MGIRFLCPTCGHRLNVKSFLAGKRGVCPQCGAGLDIPLDSQITKGGSVPTEEELSAVPMTPSSPSSPSSPAPAGSPQAQPQHPGNAVPSLSDAEWLNDIKTGSPTGAGVGLPDVPGVDTMLGAMRSRSPDPLGNSTPAPTAPSKPLEAGPPTVPMRPATPFPVTTPSTPAATAQPAVPMRGSGTSPPAVPMTSRAATGNAQTGRTGPPAVPMPAAPVAVAAPLDPIQEAPEAIWYVRPPSGGQYGPARGDILRKWIGEGRVSHDSLVWREGWNDWRTASQVFAGLGLAGAPPAPVMPVSVAYAPTSPRPASTRPNYPARRRNSLTFAVATVAVLAVMSVGLLIVLAWLLSHRG
jgi:hypothetical protein